MPNRRVSRRQMLSAVGAAGILAGCPGVSDEQTDASPSSSAAPTDTSTTATDSSVTDTSGGTEEMIYVAPDGSDDNDGSQNGPVETVTEGLQRAQPGETVRLRPGEYNEAIFTVRDGQPDDPITIEGPEDAVIRPPPETYSAVTVRHHHVHLRGMTINGLIDPSQKYEDWRAWAGNCVQVNPVSRADEGVEYVRGAVVEPAKAGNTRNALIQTARIRDAVIGSFELIGPTGMKQDPRVANHQIGHVGEIVYVGNPADKHEAPGYPYDTPERTRNVRIHHIDNSTGYSHNEFVEVKPGCRNVTVEYCTDRNAGHNTEGLVEPAILISGNDCTVRWNDIGNCPSPIGFNSWKMDGTEWAKNNAVYGNHIHGFAAGALNFRSREGVQIEPADQRILCGNQINRGDPNIEPWVPESNGFDGQVVDRRGQQKVSIRVGAGPDGHAFDPPVVIVDPGTTISWEWVEDSGAHYVVSRVRVTTDPDNVSDPIEGSYSTSVTVETPEMKRYVCYNHHNTGMRSAVVVAADEDRFGYAMGNCDSSIPDGEGIGHTGGNAADA